MRMHHNEGTIIRPLGRPNKGFSVVPDSIFTDATLTPTCRLILAYLVGRPDGWVACVSDICKKLALSENTWRSSKRHLQNSGIIPRDHPKRMGGGLSKFTWVLDISLERYCLNLSTTNPPKSTDGSHSWISMHGKTTDKQNEFSSTRTPQQLVSGGDFDENRNAASAEQRQILDSLLADPPAGIKYPTAWRLTLSRKAMAGKLTAPFEQPAAAKYQTLKRNKKIVGFIATCPRLGRIKAIADFEFSTSSGDLRGDDADRIWRRINDGDLFFEPLPTSA